MERPGVHRRAAEAGFLDANDDGTYSIHDLYDHAPDYVQKRMVRKGTAPDGVLPSVRGGLRRKTEPRRSEAEENGAAAEPNGAEAERKGDETEESGGYRQETRDKRQERNSEDSPEPAEPASGPFAPLVPVEPPVLEFPCVGSGPKVWPLTASKIAEWADSYPAVAVLSECRKARQWLWDNPTKRKTFAGMAKFLRGLAQGRCQDQQGASTPPTSPVPDEGAKRRKPTAAPHEPRPPSGVQP